MKCIICHSDISNDSRFCNYCGHKIINRYPYANPYNQHTNFTHEKQTCLVEPSINYSSAQNSQTKSKKFTDSLLTVFIIAVVVFIIVIVSVALNSDKDSNFQPESELQQNTDLVPVTEPRSGAILSGVEVFNGSEITINASSGESCVVKLKTLSGTTRLSFYVRAGDTVTVGVPAEMLYVYFAAGDTWYGERLLFGEDTSYSMDDDICNFKQYTLEYTLYPSISGNFTQTPITEDEF